MVAIVALVLVGSLLSTVDSGRGVARWDRTLADWGSTNATTRSTSIWKAVTRLGSAFVLTPMMSIVALVDWRRRRDVLTVWFLAIVGVGESLLNNVLKMLVGRDRPPVVHLVDAGDRPRSEDPRSSRPLKRNASRLGMLEACSSAHSIAWP
ncbi:MAG: hypothetical protein E4H05_10400 [Acidimicrobiales bacterium]|nr:MAG: hypothetical protein E4H05_10400 [Acidimicrobiales bacterium]